jgi:hypothetical protein
MSTPSPVLVAVVATLSVSPGTPLPPANAAQASISVVVTDSAGTVYPAVVLTGAETPTPWSYSATFASGAATAVATALDINGATIGTPASYSFTVPAPAAPATFDAPAGFGVVAANASSAIAAIHKANSVKA